MLISRLFGSREDFTKSKYYYGNLGIEESIVTLQDVKAHRFLRNSLNPFFTPQAALDQRSLISDEIRKLLITLRGNPQNPSLADIQSLLGQLFVST
jgi:cytochrome P450